MGKMGQRAWKDAPTLEDFRKLLEAAAGGREKLILHLLGTVGLRNGEVVGLRGNCLDEEGYLDVLGTKTRFARRRIPLRRYHPEVYHNLLRYFELYERMRPGTQEGIQLLVLRVAERADIEAYPHALRGRAAYDMARAFHGDAVKFCAWMGWKSLAEADAYIRASGAVWFDEKGR